MAGGIFTGRPFEFNMKCIVFSAILMLSYWYLPKVNRRNIFMLPLIFVVSYVSLAWYDWLYNCQTKMYSGNKGLSLSSPFKPMRKNDKVTGSRDKYLVPEKEQNRLYLKTIYLFHVFAIAPILVYIGLNRDRSDKRVYNIILYIGILTLLYHSFRFFNPREIL